MRTPGVLRAAGVPRCVARAVPALTRGTGEPTGPVEVSSRRWRELVRRRPPRTHVARPAALGVLARIAPRRRPHVLIHVLIHRG
jgi:hypothetical protein